MVPITSDKFSGTSNPTANSERIARAFEDRAARRSSGRPAYATGWPVAISRRSSRSIVVERDAVAAVGSGRAPEPKWNAQAKELLDRQTAAEKASESIIQVVTMQQPPADLLISITPGVRKLVEAAVRLGV
jgi:hypothetical protein